MKTLILMRHAKSSWATLGLDDHDRPLNKRGRKAAPAMANWLAMRDLVPDTVICSTARRVRETFHAMQAVLPGLPEPSFHDMLYHADPGTLHAHVRALPEEAQTALLIAHEPGLSGYAEKLGGPDAPADCRRAYGHFPTAAAAVFHARIGAWHQLRATRTDFAGFATPREMDGD